MVGVGDGVKVKVGTGEGVIVETTTDGGGSVGGNKTGAAGWQAANKTIRINKQTQRFIRSLH